MSERVIDPERFDPKPMVGGRSRFAGEADTAQNPQEDDLQTYVRKAPVTQNHETAKFPKSQDADLRAKGWLPLDEVTTAEGEAVNDK